MERDCRKGGEVMAVSDFNSHAHVERDGIFRSTKKSNCNFNSHAHVERDDFVKSVDEETGISTHTLTWSVTF